MKPKKYEWKQYGYCGKHGFGSCECLKSLPTNPKLVAKMKKSLSKALFTINQTA